MSNIDFSQVITAEAGAEAADRARLAARKADCRVRIHAVADQIAQINLAAAAAAGALDEGQMALYRAGLGWIEAMRAACASGADWPDVPPGVADLAAAF
jgi:hypothetical protein